MTQAFNRDCMEAMREFPDKFFDLAIVDPPYGLSIGINGKNSSDWGVSKSTRENTGLKKAKKYPAKNWDLNVPPKEYFAELFRVSKNQIIWGGNNFDLSMKNYIVWYKMGKSNNPKYSDTELAFVSWKIIPKMVDIWWNGLASTPSHNNGESRIHPTQKPIALYKWLLKNYAKEGDKILDTHLGSGSSRIAADSMGFDFWGYELDKEYFDASVKRFNQYKAQLNIFK